jgi:hypothetical protein
LAREGAVQLATRVAVLVLAELAVLRTIAVVGVYFA